MQGWPAGGAAARRETCPPLGLTLMIEMMKYLMKLSKYLPPPPSLYMMYLYMYYVHDNTRCIIIIPKFLAFVIPLSAQNTHPASVRPWCSDTTTTTSKTVRYSGDVGFFQTKKCQNKMKHNTHTPLRRCLSYSSCSCTAVDRSFYFNARQHADRHGRA